MRYRFFFTFRLQQQAPIEVDCGKWVFHPKADRRIIVWPSARSRLTVDIFFPDKVTVVKDDHGRQVWPNVDSVIAKAKRK